MFQKTTVHASNDAELELGFRTADRIVVEGDSALLERAEQWAKHGAPGSLVDEADDPATVQEGEEGVPAAGGPQPSRLSVWLWLVFGLLVFVLGVSGTLYLNRDGAGVRGALPTAAEASGDSLISFITLLVWPTVALLALCMMFFLARQALTTGADVSLEWKVTKNVFGKVVITKVRAPRRR